MQSELHNIQLLKDKDKQFFDLVWALCKRPGLFTANSKAGEIWSFIHGAEIGFFEPNIIENHSPLLEFGFWLENQFQVESSNYWMTCIISNPELFNSMLSDEIWNVFEGFYFNSFRIKYESVKIMPCSYS